MKTNMRASGAPRVALLLSLLTPAMALADTPRAIAKRVSPSVVLLITGDAEGNAVGLGSAFVVRKGVVATNWHVVENAASAYIKATNDQTPHRVRGVIAADQARDLVLLAVDGLEADPLPLGDSAALAVGQTIYTIGNPHGLEGSFSAGVESDG